MKKNKINILGINYEIIISNQKVMQKKFDNPNVEVCGLCDYSEKKIYIDENVAKDKYGYSTTLRHELIHAILEECGIGTQVSWAKDETLVDWIALQFPKMIRIFKEMNVED